MRMLSVGGMCRRECISCGFDETVKGVTVHMTRLGGVQKVGAAGATTEEQRMALENISYDETLYTLSDKLCPSCSSPLRVWMTNGYLYTFLCPKCHKVVEKPK